MKSKKIAIVLVFCLTTLLPFGTAAQEVLTVSDLGITVQTGIIRQWQSRPPATISYLTAGNEHQFVFSDDMMVLKRMNIDARYDVKDFVVGKSHVFFCGHDSQANKGFFGWFVIDPEQWGVSGYYIFNNFIIDASYDIQNFDGLVLINESDSVRLAVVGHAADLSYCIMRIAGHLPLASTGWDYTSGYTSLFQRSNSRICMTKNYIATLGFEPGYHEPYFRIYDKNNMFASSGIQEDEYSYHYTRPLDHTPSCFLQYTFHSLTGFRFSEKHNYDPHHCYSDSFNFQNFGGDLMNNNNEIECENQ